jgi:hypothetical protein
VQKNMEMNFVHTNVLCTRVTSFTFIFSFYLHITMTQIGIFYDHEHDGYALPGGILTLIQIAFSVCQLPFIAHKSSGKPKWICQENLYITGAKSINPLSKVITSLPYINRNGISLVEAMNKFIFQMEQYIDQNVFVIGVGIENDIQNLYATYKKKCVVTSKGEKVFTFLLSKLYCLQTPLLSQFNGNRPSLDALLARYCPTHKLNEQKRHCASYDVYLSKIIYHHGLIKKDYILPSKAYVFTSPVKSAKKQKRHWNYKPEESDCDSGEEYEYEYEDDDVSLVTHEKKTVTLEKKTVTLEKKTVTLEKTTNKSEMDMESIKNLLKEICVKDDACLALLTSYPVVGEAVLKFSRLHANK